MECIFMSPTEFTIHRSEPQSLFYVNLQLASLKIQGHLVNLSLGNTNQIKHHN